MPEMVSFNVYGYTYQPDPIILPERVLNVWNWGQEMQDACARAQAAFQRHLTPSQQYYWKRWRWCWVEAPSGRIYKIKNSWCWNIQEYEPTNNGWQLKSRWCLSTKGDCPAEDRYLTQLLYLRYNEKEFRRVANEQAWFARGD